MCMDYYEAEQQRKREREAQARADREEKARLAAEATSAPSTKLPADLSLWGKSTTARIYESIGAKSGKLPASLKGTFNVDGYKILVKTAKAARGGARTFLVVSAKRHVAIGNVGRAKFTHAERNKMASAA